MTVGTDGGLTNPADAQSFVIGEAISQAGTLVKLADTGKMMICGAGEEPDGYMMTDTKDHVTEVAMANVYRGVGSFIPGRKIRVPVLATNDDIAIGDKLETTAGGTVDKKSGAGYLIGKALEAVASNAGGFVTVRVYKEYASA
ncbi:MAG: hypothetical protein PHT97_10855 [Methanoculleus sp.]|uniref:hypothetical protein n=1 Tax=Methanoculleus sp. TaxID=90427 RepID=UPI00260A74A7|nr:hypothetical protein [Methanoculleus sp.]MDD2255198.1 hypothetical protein [Methanoculleus sp.]MDD4471640.1 hypothetical protein [Methanoculleus sp.]